jgi:hypothetical protein
MTLLGGGVIPLSPSDRFASGGVFNLAAIIRRIIRVVSVRGVTDGLRQHIGRWAHEEQSAGNDPGRGGIRQRLLSSCCRPKRRRRNEKAEFHRRPGETKFDWRPGEADFHCQPGEAKSAEAGSRRQRGEANLTRRPGREARVGRCLPVTVEAKRYAVIEPLEARNERRTALSATPVCRWRGWRRRVRRQVQRASFPDRAARTRWCRDRADRGRQEFRQGPPGLARLGKS